MLFPELAARAGQNQRRSSMNCSQELRSRLSNSFRFRSCLSQRALSSSWRASTEPSRSLCLVPHSRSCSTCVFCTAAVSSSCERTELRTSRRVLRSCAALSMRCWADARVPRSSTTEHESSSRVRSSSSAKALVALSRPCTVCPCSSCRPLCAEVSAPCESSSSILEALPADSSSSAALTARKASSCWHFRAKATSSCLAFVAKVAAAFASASLDAACKPRMSLLAERRPVLSCSTSSIKSAFTAATCDTTNDRNSSRPRSRSCRCVATSTSMRLAVAASCRSEVSSTRHLR
mmetsp:Transcript_36961/g.102694  ORF Transcript_36961/g.102694 Transcript_36961/m.102694 type:complete len:292 (+) Transcript_36961:35-910(+)